MHTRVGAAGFFSIHLRWLIHDGRNTTRLSLAMDEPHAVVNRTALLWEYVRNKDKKVTDHVGLYH